MRRALALVLAAVTLALPLAPLTPTSPPNPSSPREAADVAPAYGPHWMLPRPDVYPTLPFRQPPGWTGTAPASRAGGPSVRATGRQDVIILPIDFPNRPWNPPSPIATLFNDNAPGAVSAHNFYAENSYGLLDLRGTVAGVVRAPQTMEYYGADSSPSSFDDANGPIYRLVVEAVQRADPAVDFAQFDNDGPDGVPDSGDDDGVVDHVIVVHAGGAQEESGQASDIWSHRWSVADANPGIPGNQQLVADGKQIYGYIMTSEESPVGVYVHELGHDFGLPDLYDTDGSSEGIGKWDVMATGSWNALAGGSRGTMPAHFSAWSKVQLGWMRPITVPAAAPGQAIYQMETRTPSGGIPQPFKLPIRQVTSTAEEYFLVENRAQVGFDRGLPGEGLLIWHVDESQAGNADDTHRLVDLEEADDNDNPTQPGDPWPNTAVLANADGFGPDSSPNSDSYLNQRTGWRVRNISPPGATMTADLSREVLDDLVILGIQRPWAVPVGGSASVTVTVANRGARGQTDVAVDVTATRDTVTGPVVCCPSQTVPSLPPGAARNLTFTLTPAVEGRYVLQASVPLAADEIPENNVAFAHVNALWTTPTDYFFDDLEPTPEPGWWANGTASDPVTWEVVQDGNASESHSARHAWRFHRQPGLCVLCPEFHSITSRNITVPGGPVYLYVWHRYDFRGRVELNGSVETDTAYVSLSINGGPWTALPPVFSGAQSDWTLMGAAGSPEVGINLTSRITGPSTIALRFSASSNVFTDTGGWWIDDVAVTRTPLRGALAARAVLPSVTVDSGAIASHRIKVANVGDAEEEIRFTLSPPSGWIASIGRNESTLEPVANFRVRLKPDVEATLFLNLETVDAQRGRSYTVPVTAVSTTDPSVAVTFDTVTVINDPFGLAGLERYVFVFIVVLAVVIVIAVVIDAIKKQKGVYRRW